MKTKTIFASLLAMATLISCNNENEDPAGGGGQADMDVAYLSVKIQAESLTRASDEDAGEAAESDLKSLYLLTFDKDGVITAVPGGGYYTEITQTTSPIAAQKVSGSATDLLVIANPGAILKGVITGGISSTTTFATINNALADATHEELTGTNGFTMINSGDESGKNAGSTIDDPLIDISSSIKKPADYSGSDPDGDAKAAAEAARVTVKIERLASKVQFKLATSVDAGNATFTFSAWTLDGVNSTFYPWAKKTILTVAHNTGFYTNNFYTIDPNYTNSTGIKKATVDANYDPVLVPPYAWETDGTSGKAMFCIENTMDAPQQLFGNATRLVFKGTYYPKNFTNGTDWYHFAGTDYETLGALQTAYAAAPTSSNLRSACDDFYTKIKTEDPTIGTSTTKFSELTQTMLDNISNGGEIVKNGYQDGDQVIRWYQKGLCYWYYELRHDNSPTAGEMAFGKYGVVRNNWYRLTLNKVSGPGTPWFPDIDNPGPGDPDPTDPIDASTGYLGITVESAPWIVWDTDFGV